MDKFQKLVLVDGSGYIFRAYYALPYMNRADGMPVNAIFGFTNMLLKLLEDTQKDYGGNVGVAVIFDAARETFRNEIYKEYKANRADAPEDLIPQFEIIKKIPSIFNLPSIESLGFEADDLIASYCEEAIKKSINVSIVSSDKDLMQLLRNNITMFDPIKKKEITETDVLNKFGVNSTKVVDVQALAGDTSDNVPGVPGIGVKTAAHLINEFGNLENLLLNLKNIKQNKRRESLINNKNLALISKKLVTLKDDVPLPYKIENLKFKPLDVAKLLDFLDEMEFSRIKSLVISKFGYPNGKSLKNDVINEEVKDNNVNQINSKSISIKREKYQLVQSVEELKVWLKKFENFGYVAIDCETDSLSPMLANLVGFSMSMDNGQAVYIPLSHKSLDGNKIEQIELDEFLKLIKPILENEAILKIGQNIKYDLVVLKRLGLTVNNLDDTMLMSYVLSSGKNAHNLDDLSKIYCNHETIKYSDVTKVEKKKISFDYVELNNAKNYAAEDADLTFRLWTILKKKLLKEKLFSFYFYVEKPLIKIILDMEIVGIKVDKNILESLSREFERRIKEIEKLIYKESKEEFNIGSPKQLGEILFEKMLLPFGKKGKSGNYQTDVSILEKLKTSKILIAQNVLDWRQFNKLKTTYCEGLISRSNKTTNRIHTSYGMSSTTTGRLSSNDPNLQNIPIKTTEGKGIRKAFISEKGHKIVSIDYSQIELRLLAHVANIDVLRQSFNDNKDIHSITAMQVFQIKEDELSSELRRRAKTINFGIIYGISAYGLANQLDISNSEAKQYMEDYFKQYPGIKEYMETTVNNCKENGYVMTPFGRRIFIPFINDKIALRRNFGERSAINAPIQGGAADMIKRAMIKVSNYIVENRLKSKMLLQVHDELIFEVPDDEMEQVPRNIAEIMETAYEPFLDFSVPLKADIGFGESWSEAH